MSDHTIVVILVIKIFFVQFFCVFLPPLLNAEFQRIARRDKKAFLSDKFKELEENNRMGKTRDLLKKIRDTKGTFHAKMGSKWYRPNRSRRY